MYNACALTLSCGFNSFWVQAPLEAVLILTLTVTATTAANIHTDASKAADSDKQIKMHNSMIKADLNIIENGKLVSQYESGGGCTFPRPEFLQKRKSLRLHNKND